MVVPTEQFAKHGNEIGLAVLAQPLNLVFIAVRAETKEMGDAREKPAERIGKAERLQQAKLIAFAEIERS